MLTMMAYSINVGMRVGYSDAWINQLGAFENEMKNLTSQNTATVRHTHSISMSFCGTEA